jgi:hypothetical protein
MATPQTGIHLELDAEHVDTITRLAACEGTSVAALAGQLLSDAIDAAAVEPAAIEQLIDQTPGRFERIQASRAQGRAGLTVPLADLTET